MIPHQFIDRSDRAVLAILAVEQRWRCKIGAGKLMFCSEVRAIIQTSFRASWPRFRQRRISLRLKLARPGIQGFQTWMPGLRRHDDEETNDLFNDILCYYISQSHNFRDDGEPNFRREQL